MLYVMPNDKRRLLESFRQDFQAETGSPGIRVSAGDDGTLRVASPSRGLDLSLDIVGAEERRQGDRKSGWTASPWGGFVRGGAPWRMWAYPHGEALELHVSLAGTTAQARVEAALSGEGWTPVRAPEDVPALVRRSPDSDWIAALMWEQSEADNPARGVLARGKAKAEVVSARGRLYVSMGDSETLRERWIKAKENWNHSVPYRMPVEKTAGLAQDDGVRFAPNAEEGMTYGLTILSPWQDGGTLHTNFPEHFEHGDVGYGILRHHNKRPNPWKIVPDGRSASYEVESPELPGVMVRASAVAEGDRARLTLKITNGGEKTLKRVKPLLCFWYAKLTGFPGKRSDNFKHTHVVMDGRPVTLASIRTSNPAATAKVAYVRGCDQHDCDKFARSRGGLIDRDIDRALIAVAARDGKRKLIIAFTPGKSILSNTAIPCAHADPFYGTLEPGASAEATGVVVFTEKSLSDVAADLVKEGLGKPASSSASP
jgi:hypothetical protein